MLWRTSYTTKALRGLDLPPISGISLGREAGHFPTDGVLLGAFGPLVTELGIWRRLLADAYPDLRVPTLLIQTVWPNRERRAQEQGTPPALQDLTFLVEDPLGSWREKIGDIRADQSFGAVVRQGNAGLLMVGLPTEEAWDEFRAEIERT